MPHILTGNRLETGDVLWWDGSDWTLHIREAALIEPAAIEALIAEMKPAERINDLAAVEVTVEGGSYRPTTTRERVRAIGPSVRPDFALPSLPVDTI
ncbi:hypothetical protein GCM10007973_05930 [Polymorphobacter multimanifer]|uniref:DUF2849 domain-containing protein n=1 Tax=Polymorphobacter multimanifer TaxID=1070431 RepID=A0A841L0I8_9SPHN|nr:DUF2849 domain-containing protein [Polymorphobacter multimanifer]MBB6226187.1 hypothetical protein [Polymorphobacter multimanifer]GGI71773.1 hypothetical protein GCM10007973_05930 [Polymorphobacter multimanifer]